jgi:hypothetical protein
MEGKERSKKKTTTTEKIEEKKWEVQPKLQ